MRYIFIALLLSISSLTQAFTSNQQDFLPVEEAFRFEAMEDIEPNLLVWQITDKHYLYKHRTKVTDANGQVVEVDLPEGIDHSDEFFGDTQIYRHLLQVPIDADVARPIKVTWQGCADAGLCYPPQTTTLGGELTTTAKGYDSSAPISLAEDQSIAERLGDSSLLMNIFAFFIMGILLAFTPCMLPMLPILTSVITGSKKGGWQGARLGIAFILPMALVYAGLGVVAASLGSNLAATLQQPWLLLPFAGIFTLLALAQFGVYTLQLPAFIRERLQGADQNIQGGSLVGAASLGALSALLVGPCMTAPLAGALLYIAQSGDSMRGGLALFSLGLGSGIPLLLAITIGMRWLPKPGNWMENINRIFGYALLATAIIIIRPVISGPLFLGLWGALLLAIAVHINTIERPSWRFISRYLALLLGIWGGIMLFGSAAGGSDPLRPLENLNTPSQTVVSSKAEMQRFVNVQQLETQMAQAQQDGQWVLLDFYADWCVSCKVMEKTVFGKAEVQDALTDFRQLQLDVTLNTEAHKKFMQDRQIMGPPTILFIDPQGNEHRAERITGEVSASEFLRHLNSAVQDN
ncbi:protein-disulfide reductase DsbD [Denitrificimonas sp. JX-1]|uniref:Thiol:disulfide interchange protein DsbD n=1 Tax=Denitrificimonas halotolerans TaxID=3098930 RepID=A0ABU5GW29_9GAMM|nr:protein-disulfide reductase DsbD [Denitrificimonas sp. JX-1]MDY7219838.1 protein-disulfide reductase DsbD [Denitrificimonas sp. JX-1]